MRVLVVQANALVQEAIANIVRGVLPQATVVAIGKPQWRQIVEPAAEPLAAAVVDYPWVSLASLRALHRRHPTATLMVVTDRIDAATHRCLAAGRVAAVVAASAPPGVVAAALRAAMSGEVTIYGRDLRDSVAAGAGAPARGRTHDLNLTPRQSDVLALIAKGEPNRRIANELGIGVRTVKGHVAVILRALHVDNRDDARRHARRWFARRQAPTLRSPTHG